MVPPLRLPGVTDIAKAMLSAVVVAYSWPGTEAHPVFPVAQISAWRQRDEYEVIVVDNGSPQPPNPQDWIQRQGYPSVVCRPPEMCLPAVL